MSKIIKNGIALTLYFIVFIALSACGGGGGGTAVQETSEDNIVNEAPVANAGDDVAVTLG